jgi:hypothetical protein
MKVCVFIYSCPSTSHVAQTSSFRLSPGGSQLPYIRKKTMKKLLQKHLRRVHRQCVNCAPSEARSTSTHMPWLSHCSTQFSSPVSLIYNQQVNLFTHRLIIPRLILTQVLSLCTLPGSSIAQRRPQPGIFRCLRTIYLYLRLKMFTRVQIRTTASQALILPLK